MINSSDIETFLNGQFYISIDNFKQMNLIGDLDQYKEIDSHEDVDGIHFKVDVHLLANVLLQSTPVFSTFDYAQDILENNEACVDPNYSILTKSFSLNSGTRKSKAKLWWARR